MKIFAIVLIGATLVAPPQTFSPDADGFIRNWLILAPIAFDGLGRRGDRSPVPRR